MLKRATILAAGLLMAGGFANYAQAQCVGPFCIGKKPKPAPAPAPAPPPSAPNAGFLMPDAAAGGTKACIDTICLGDGLDTLGTVTWDIARQRSNKANPPPTKGRPITSGETAMIARRYRGNTTAAQSYLADEKFDGGALAGLAGITAACEAHYLTGYYTTASGNPTLVEIAMVADPNDLSSQRWTVRRMQRSLPNASTEALKQEATAQIKAKYGNSVVITTGNGILSFSMRLPSVPNESYVLSVHPACGGNGGKGSSSID